MKHLLKLAIPLIILCSLIGCKPEEEKPGSIFGVVTDFATSEPVSGANVQLRPSGETAQTGSDGMYEFTEVPVGSYSITVSKAEYTDLVDDYVIEVKEGKRMRRDVQIKKRPLALHLYDNDSNEISELDFGDDEGVTQKTFNIFNGGTQKIDYTIRKTVDWITEVSDPTGTINTGVTKPIVVTIDRRKLAVGDNNTILTITASEGGGRELTVKAKNIIKAPTVNIQEANAIDSVTYRIRCEVESDGGLTVSERGICWSTYGTPTLDDETSAYSSGGTGQYTIRMEHLTMATHYYVRAYAKNQIGIGFSEMIEFVTGEIITLPSVTTVEVKEVTATSAVCQGNVTDDGGADLIECGVCWATSANPTINGQHQAASSATVGEFSVSITGLTSNTTYHVRAYAKNSRGTAYGRDLTFTTTDGQPTVTTASVTNITATSAKCGGTVTNQGASAVTERGVCWSTNHNPTLDNDHTNSGTGTGSFTVNMTGLTPNKTYYVRAYAKNTQGIAYGSEVSFKALDGLPVVSTTSVQNITATSAKGCGNVTDQGGSAVTERGVCWGTEPSPSLSDNHDFSGMGTGGYTVNMTDLTPTTKYYVRAYAINSQGTSYGEQVEFTTKANIPTVTTSDPTDITQNTATAGGEVTDDGGTNVTARGVCWSTSPHPTISGSYANNGTGLGSYTVSMTNLKANTTYYIRAFAQNSAGTAYGNEVSFTTSPIPTYSISVSADPANGGTVTGGGSYQNGQQCTVTATASSGYSFSDWTENGASVSTSASYTFTVTGDRNLLANFTAKTYTITVSANPANGGNVSGGGTYSYGQSCTVTAVPVSGYSFLRWMEGSVSVSSNSTFTFTVTNDRTFEANFIDNVGTIKGLFSVNQYNKQVYFSQGNLQYVGSSNTWQFADNQWDMIGESQSNFLQGTTRDLFAWGTSGYSHGAVCYHPWDFTLYETDYWAYGNAGMDLDDGNGRADWGYNAISNGGNMENSGWRTLTGDEWNYVFNTRTTTSGIRYAKACVNDVNGVILLPDNWNSSIYVLNSINAAKANFNTNVINASEWKAVFEGNGAVFLPAAGEFFNGNASGNNYGSYWSASHFTNTKAYMIYFTSSDLKYYYYNRPYGFSVRLVRDAQ